MKDSTNDINNLELYIECLSEITDKFNLISNPSYETRDEVIIY